MRSLTAGETTTLGLPYHDRDTHTIVRIQNIDGTWKTLTSLDSLNRVSSVEWTRTADQPVSSGTVTIHRKDLSPLDETSSYNVDDLGAYAPLLDGARRLDIQTATVQSGVTPTSGDYHTMFDGTVRNVQFPGEDWIHLEVHDRIERHLQSQLIFEETKYGTEAGRPLEDVLQDMLDDWDPDDVATLWVPTAPGQSVTPTPWNSIELLQAMHRYASWIGWTLRSQWNSSVGEFQLMLEEPDRDATTTDWDLARADIFEYQNVDLPIARVRNDIRVRYTTAAGERKEVRVVDQTSIDRYGRQPMVDEEADDSPINTESEATTLANAILADLKDPELTQTTRGAYFFPVQLGDFIGFAADDRWYSSGQDLGVFSITHRLGGPDNPMGAETILGVRGKPAGQYTRWRAWETGPGVGSEAPYDISYVKEIDTTSTTKKYEVGFNPQVHHVLVFQLDAAPSSGGDPWPGADDHIATLHRNDNQVTFTLPESGKIGYVMLQPEGIKGTRGKVRRFELRPPESATMNTLVTFDPSGDAVVSASAGEDSVAIYITVGDGETPDDPTKATHDAKIPSDEGQVDTEIHVSAGNYAFVKLVAEDVDGNLGTVNLVKQRRELGPLHVNTTTATTSTADFETLHSFTVPAGHLGRTGGFQLRCWFDVSGTNGTKQLSVQFGGQNLYVGDVTSSSFEGVLKLILVCYNTSATTQYVRGELVHDGDPAMAAGFQSPTVDTRIARDIKINADVATLPDTVSVDLSELIYLGAV